jgi:hypothetical protein
MIEALRWLIIAAISSAFLWVAGMWVIGLLSGG